MQSYSRGHKAIKLGVIQKGIISAVCMPNMKSLSLMVQIGKVKVDNGQDKNKVILP